MEHFSVGGNLRVVAEELKWPPLQEYEEMMTEFCRTFSVPTRGSLLDNIIPLVSEPSMIPEDAKLETLDEENYQLLLARINHDIPNHTMRYVHVHLPSHDSPSSLSQEVQYVRSVKKAGVAYSPCGKRNSGNSFILVNLYGDRKTALVPAQIHAVFLHSRHLTDGTNHVEPFFVARLYCPLSEEDQSKDPYLAFPLLDTRLYYNTFCSRSHVLKEADIVCHFASYVYEPENIVDQSGKKRPCIVVRSLDRS